MAKFKLYEELVSLKIGELAKGRVLEILDPVHFWEMYPRFTKVFDEFYPMWLDYPVYLINYEKPNKGYNLEAYKRVLESDNYSYMLHGGVVTVEQSFNQLSCAKKFYFPEQDLELSI